THTINSMSPPIPRIARVPLTSKQHEACPHCGGKKLTRRGTRRKKLEIVQLWRCAACKRTFTPAPAELRNKTYPLRMIHSAITDYDHRQSDHGFDEYKQHCSYRRLRAADLKRYPANQTIRSIKLYHRRIYGYA